MDILHPLRNRRSKGPERDSQAANDTQGDDELAIEHYDRLDDREVGARLSDLSQVELEAVETYERSHKERPEVLHKLRYLRESEPMPGYDALTTKEIAEWLAHADAQSVKAVRDYERKFAKRPQVMDEAMRVLPAAKASAGEDRADEERNERIRSGIANRGNSSDDPAG